MTKKTESQLSDAMKVRIADALIQVAIVTSGNADLKSVRESLVKELTALNIKWAA